MPRYRVLIDAFQYDMVSSHVLVQTLSDEHPDSDAGYEFREGLGAWVNLTAPDSSAAEKWVVDAARRAGVDDPTVELADPDTAN